MRFRKTVKIAPGIKLNLSKSGVSTSVGKSGATVNVGKNGTKATIGIPGSGLSQEVPITKRQKARRKPESSGSSGPNIVGILLIFILGMAALGMGASWVIRHLN